MSIELDVKIRAPQLRTHEFVSAIIANWNNISIVDSSLNFPSGVLEDENRVIDGDFHLSVKIAKNAEVRCDFYCVDGDEESYDSGLWGSIGVSIRNKESLFLMTVCAFALARIAKSEIVDEGNILGFNRMISTDDIKILFESVKGLSLTEASDLFHFRKS